MNSLVHIAPTEWLTVFPEQSRRNIPRDVDVYSYEYSPESVFLVEQGAAAEIRYHEDGTSHVVGFTGRNEILIAGRPEPTRSTTIRATAVTDCIVRMLSKGDFTLRTLAKPELASLYMRQLAKKLEVARELSTISSLPASADHVLAILKAVARNCGFGVSEEGKSPLSIRPSLLERMTGTPPHILSVAMHQLLLRGEITFQQDSVQWPT